MARNVMTLESAGPRKDYVLNHPIYYTIVGDKTSTNVGLLRFMSVIVGFIVTGGVSFWLIE